jgi:hypothetical protein
MPKLLQKSKIKPYLKLVFVLIAYVLLTPELCCICTNIGYVCLLLVVYTILHFNNEK